MANTDWSKFTPEEKQTDWSQFKPEGPEAEQDGPLTRGFKRAINSARTAYNLTTGDADAGAALAAERADYARKNPGSPEGNELMAAWERGDGVTGGIKEVAGEVAKDWTDAPNVMSAVRATGKNLGAMGGGILEQMPNMVAPMAGMLAGGAAGSLAGPAGTVGGAFAGATAGNTAMEAAEQVDRAIRQAGINPEDKEAVKAYLAANGDTVLGQAATKGAIIGAVDTATMGAGHLLLSAPGKAAAGRALEGMGVDLADRAAVKAAMASDDFAARVASDTAYQASQKGLPSLARNATVAALEPAGEFAGEYLGQGAATGDWDTKGAALEALSSLGQGAVTFAGQKLYEAATSPLRGKEAPPVPSPGDVDQANADLGFAVGQYADLIPSEQRLLGSQPSVITVPTQDGGTTTIDRNTGPLSDIAVDVVQGQIQTGMPLRAYATAMDAQAALDQRPDGERMRVAPHPRASGRYAVVPKTAEALTAIDRKAEAQVKSEERLATVESEDGNASQVATTGGQGSGTVAGGSAGDSPSVGGVTGGRGGAAGASAPGRGTDTSLGDASVGDAALDELAPAPVQPISSMPAAERVKAERQAAARAEAQARGAQLTDDEVSSANTEPTEAQQAAGNYQKGHVKIGGLDISIENPAGSTRSGKEGKKSWSVQMSDHYGYIKRTEGADGEQVDVYVKAGTATDHNGPVFVVDQYNPKTGQFDEHKAFVGYRTALDVTRAYDAHFSDGTGPKRRKGITKMAPDAFTAWARHGDTSQAADKAQAEIAQSTGKESKKRSNGDLYQAAAEANKRKQERRLPTEQNDTLAVREATGAEVSVVSEKDLPEADAAPAGHVSRQTAEFARHVAKLFGKRVVFVKGMPSDGFYNHGNTLYLSTTGSVHHLRILGHEMLHALRSQSKETYAKLLESVRDVVTDAQLKSQFRDYFSQDKSKKDWTDDQITEWLADDKNRDFLTEEWMADLSGNRWTEAGFWEDVFTQVENKYGSEQAKGIIAKLRLALVTALNKLKTLVRGSAFAVDGRVTEHLDQIRAALATGFADYAKAVKDGQVEQGPGPAKFARGTANQTLPTRWPTSKALKPSVNDDMITDLATLKQDPKQYAKAVAAILEEPGMHSADIVAGDIDTQAEHIIGRMQSNLLWLYDQVPEAVRNRSKLWYDGAREIADRWASAYDITQSQAAGALAVLSPQKDWFMNVTMAERVLDILRDKMNHRWDDRMDSAAFSFLTKEAGREDPDGAKNMKAYEAVKGKTLAEVTKHHDLRQMGIWIRAYDEAYHDAKHAIVTPEGGFVEDKTTVKGEPTLRAWGDFTTAGKAASIYLDGSPENINKQLGGEHKVRNFYNNIYAPKDPRFTTIDTHAVAADLLRPLAGADKPVAENFGKTGGTNLTGLSGTYALHYEAYRRAAAEREVLPREMQSITWEAVRGLFTEGFKGKKENLRAVDDVWRQVDGGELSVPGARNRILEMAGGIEQPDWWNEGNAEYQAVLRDKTYVQERKAFVGAKVTFEVAPDPRNAELKGRWEALSPEARHAISDKVAWKIAAKALASFNDDNMKGELHHQMGGWMADTNPSLSIWFNKRASGTKINQFARMLGTALRQESMMRTSPRPFKGMDGEKVKPAGAIIIDRKPGDSVEDIYAKVRMVVDPKGKPYVFGHTTDDGHMVIIHQDEAAISTVDLHHRIDEALGGDYDVSYSNIYVEFLNQGRNSYGFTGKKADPADASARTRANQLRAEADVLFEQLVGDAKLSTQRSNAARDGRNGSSDARTSEEVRGYGTAAPGAVTVQGTHYSQQERANLDGRYYGTGMRGAEGPRVQAAADPRLKERVYFYVDKGTGVRPEDGVGSIAHTAQLNNVYDANADTWVQAKVGRELAGDAWLNAFESSVIDNGFDGYVTDFGTQRAAVLLGRHNVPVTRGKGGVSETKQAAVTAKRTDLPMGKMTGAEWKKLEPRATELEDDKSYYRDQVRFSPSRFDTIAEAFADRARKALANPRNTQPVLIHSNTPASMQILGWADRKLIVEASELAKIASKPGFETDEKIGNLVLDLARPGAMFWNDKQGSLNILRREDMRGAPALIAVRPGVPMGIDRAHLMVTAHRLENQGALLRKITSGELKPLYLDQANPLIKQAMQTRKYRVSTLDLLAPENLHARASVQLDTSSRLLSEADLVKWEQDNWGDAPKFSPSRAQTETPEFKKWYEGSNLRNADGSPMVLYHGTNKDFSRFGISKTGAMGPGVYLGDDPEVANAYSDGTGANVMPVYARGRYIGNREWSSYVSDYGWKKGREKAIEDGVAGVWDQKFESAVLVFDPANIKSAIGNNGQFDGTNPDIRYSPSRWYFSPLQRAVDQAPDRVFTTAPQVKAWLLSNAGKLGVKQDEIVWSGITDWLDLQGKQKVGKGQVLQYLSENGVQIEEVEKGKTGYNEDDPALPEGRDLKVIEADEEYHGRLASRYKYVVIDEASDTTKGWGNSEAEAIADAHSGHPEYWEGNDATQYSQYVLPGGKNYRELLLTLPEKEPDNLNAIAQRMFGKRFSDLEDDDANAVTRAEREQKQSENYSSPHWGEKNILAHVRMNDRTDADGNRVLFIEELQSDWGQAGKKTGFGKPSRTTIPLAPGEYQAFMARMKEAASKELERRTEGKVEPEIIKGVIDSQPLSQVAEWAGLTAEFDALSQRNLDDATPSKNTVIPTAPFVTDTKAWVSLAVKRMIAYAVENGYDKVAFVNGEQSADRYDLSKKIESIGYDPKVKRLEAYDKNRSQVIDKTVSEDQLEDYIGKEVAKRLLEQPLVMGKHLLDGEEIKVGGEGMKAFYDKIVPQTVSDVLKKVGGGKLESVRVGVGSVAKTSDHLGFDTSEIQFKRDAAGNWGVEKNPDTVVGGKRLYWDGSSFVEDEGSARVFGSKEEATASVTASRQTGFSITPAMREQVSRGLPLFSLARKVSDAVNSTLGKLDAAVDGLSNLPDQFDYLRDRYLALGKIARVDEISTEVRKAFDGAAPADKQAVYDYLTTRGATTGRISDHKLRSIAKRIKDTINYTGDQLVARGLLDQEARDHYRDQYLPRMYLRHMLDDQAFKVIGMGKKPSDMGYLKHRKDIPQEIRDVVLGEIKDPSFLSVNAIGRAMRDVSLLDWMGKIAQNNDWVFPEIFVPWQGKKVTAYWLRAEADRIENQSTHYTPANKTKADALVAQMRSTAHQALGSMSAIDHKKFKQIPDTRRYGLLRGMWVRTEIYNDIMGASQIVNADPTWFEDWFGFGGKGTRLTQWWKFTKVAANPPGQIRNFISNMVMLQLSGIGLHRLPFALIEAARDITNNGKYWQVAKKYGVTESTFTAQELFRVKRDLVEMEAQKGKLSSLRWLMSAGSRFFEGVSDLYQFSEALGKTIKIMEEMKAGKSEAEAAIEAQKWLFDYSLVPQSVRIARNAPVGMPFLTYQVKVLPRLLEVAAKHPWRFLPWAGLLYGMQAAVASMFGVDDDELKKLKKSLPEWLQDRGHTVFLPFRDADGRLQVADVGYFFPWTFYSQTGKHVADGKVKKALVDDVGGQFSAPILGAAAALMANYDTFTKQPIYKETDPVGYQAAAIANYAYDLMAPPFISSHGVVSPMGLVDTKFGGKLTQALAGTTNRFGDPKATEEQALGAMLGFNFYGMDPEHTRVTNLKVMEFKVHEAEKGLKQRLMDKGLSSEQRLEAIRDYRERMSELQQEMLEYAKESQVPEQLKAKKR